MGISINSMIFVLQPLMTILIVNLFVVVIVNCIFSKNTNSYNMKFKQIIINNKKRIYEKNCIIKL